MIDGYEYSRKVSACLERSTSLIIFVLRQHTPILRVGNLQALRVASETLPYFMRGFATRTEVEAILTALAVSSAWFGLSFCNVGGVGLSFCLACVSASTVRALRVTQKMVGPDVADILN